VKFNPVARGDLVVSRDESSQVEANGPAGEHESRVQVHRSEVARAFVDSERLYRVARVSFEEP